MPIKPENVARYPANWKQLRAAVLERAGHCCEGSPAYPDCRAPNGMVRVRDQVRIVLTIAHLEHDDLETQDITRLRAWCQKCHLTYDAKHHAQTARKTRRDRLQTPDMFA